MDTDLSTLGKSSSFAHSCHPVYGCVHAHGGTFAFMSRLFFHVRRGNTLLWIVSANVAIATPAEERSTASKPVVAFDTYSLGISRHSMISTEFLWEKTAKWGCLSKSVAASAWLAASTKT